MTSTPYITASCTISNQTAYKNGQVLYAGTETDPVDFFAAVYKQYDFAYPRFYKMDSLSKLGWLTSEILLRDHFEAGKYQPEEVGLVFCNADASLDTDIKYLATTKELASPSVFVYTLPNIVAGEICIRNHFKGESAFFISEKFDADFLQQYVNNLLEKDILQACICGWIQLFGKEYKAVLFLVEKQQQPGGTIFTVENITTLFQSENE